MIPFQEQGSSSEEFQLVKELTGSSLMACLKERRADPSSFKERTLQWELKKKMRSKIEAAEYVILMEKRDHRAEREREGSQSSSSRTPYSVKKTQRG